jgi:hypothetical protein
MSLNCHKNIRAHQVSEFLTKELDMILKIVLNMFVSIITKVIPHHYGNGEIKCKTFTPS